MTIREINLIPDEMLYRREVVLRLRRWGIGLIVCLAVIFGIHGYQTRYVLAKLRPATTLSDMHTRLGATLEEITNTQKEIDRLSLQQSIVQELTLHLPYSSLLQTLAAAMNPHTWLVRLEIDSAEASNGGNRMTLEGYALSNELLAVLLTHLSTAPPVDGVVLKFAKDATVSGVTTHADQVITAVHFEVDCRLKGPKQ
ncbi:MAG: PilN domain-containing protein [Desulfobacteraceae bacterium]|jgi:Tfp pilus assembly protein PilN